MYHVLIADSSDMEMRFLTRFFRRLPQQYDVVGCADTREQLLAFAGRKHPDILFLDTEFDQGNWLQIARSLRRLYPSLIIILNGLYPDFNAAQEAILLGVNAYLMKPAQDDQIAKTLNYVERSQNIHTGSIALPSESDGYPFAAEQRLINTLTSQNRSTFNDEAAQFLFELEGSYRGQDFRAYICHLFLQIRWRMEQLGIAQSLLAVLDTDLYIKDVTTTPNFQEIKNSIHHYFDRISQMLTAAQEVQPSCTELVTNYIRENFTEKITLEDLAERFHFNATHIARCLKRSVGKTLHAYVNGLRIDKAVELITKTDLPIFKIANASGFPNVSHFNRVFRDHTGMSPTQLRKSERYGLPGTTR
jgi:YesN/AraC family two-component response regulator